MQLIVAFPFRLTVSGLTRRPTPIRSNHWHARASDSSLLLGGVPRDWRTLLPVYVHIHTTVDWVFVLLRGV
jgi:hypothetical protein